MSGDDFRGHYSSATNGGYVNNKRVRSAFAAAIGADSGRLTIRANGCQGRRWAYGASPARDWSQNPKKTGGSGADQRPPGGRRARGRRAQQP